MHFILFPAVTVTTSTWTGDHISGHRTLIDQKFIAKSIPQLHGKVIRKAFYRRHSDLVFCKLIFFLHPFSEINTRASTFAFLVSKQYLLIHSIFSIATDNKDYRRTIYCDNLDFFAAPKFVSAEERFSSCPTYKEGGK